jgi:hypothetical protein
MECVLANYDAEAKAARSIAGEFFDATKVCTNLLARAMEAKSRINYASRVLAVDDQASSSDISFKLKLARDASGHRRSKPQLFDGCARNDNA